MNATTLFDLVQRLDELDDPEPSRPLVVYAQGGADAGRGSPALVCRRGEEGGKVCPLDSTLSEVLPVEQAREAMRVWSEWRGGITPTSEERFRTVMFYARNGAFVPLETDREGM
jgi:hypothetical protein